MFTRSAVTISAVVALTLSVPGHVASAHERTLFDRHSQDENPRNTSAS